MSTMFHIANYLQKNYALTQEDAAKVYPALKEALENGTELDLSFEGLENCSTIFLRHTLGALYLQYGQRADQLIHIIGISADNDLLPMQLDRLKERAFKSDTYQPIFEQAVGKA